jgi:hypothetical protein
MSDKPATSWRILLTRKQKLQRQIAAAYHPSKASIDHCNYSKETTNVVRIWRTIHPWFQYPFTGSTIKHTEQVINQIIELRFSTINYLHYQRMHAVNRKQIAAKSATNVCMNTIASPPDWNYKLQIANSVKNCTTAKVAHGFQAATCNSVYISWWLLQVRTINYGMSPDKPSRLQKFPDKQKRITETNRCCLSSTESIHRSLQS